MAENVIYVDDFANKSNPDWMDYIAEVSGTGITTGEPQKTRFSDFVKTILDRTSSYLFLGKAEPTTIPPTGVPAHIKLCYIASAQNASFIYDDFKQTNGDSISLSNEVALIKSVWHDNGLGTYLLRWTKEALFGFGGGGNSGITDAPQDDKLYGRKNNAWEEAVEEAMSSSTLYGRKDGAWEPAAEKAELMTLNTFISENFIGVIKSALSPTSAPSNSNRVDYSGGWKWKVPSHLGGAAAEVDLPVGTKVFNMSPDSNISGVEQFKTYILIGNGAVQPEEEFNMIDFIKHHVGVVTTRGISGAGDPPPLEQARWHVETMPPSPPPEWRYYVSHDEYIVLQPGSVVKVVGDGTGNAVYYELKANGVYTQITF